HWAAFMAASLLPASPVPVDWISMYGSAAPPGPPLGAIRGEVGGETCIGPPPANQPSREVEKVSTCPSETAAAGEAATAAAASRTTRAEAAMFPPFVDVDGCARRARCKRRRKRQRFPFPHGIRTVAVRDRYCPPERTSHRF